MSEQLLRGPRWLPDWQWLRNPQSAWFAGAVLVAVAAYALAHRYLAGQASAVRAQAAAAYATRDVLVAGAALAAGQRIEPAALALRAVPERFLPSDALEPAALDGALGQRLQRGLRPGEVLTRSALEPPSLASIASQLGPGERAYTLPVDESAGAAGLLAPGDRVDVLFVPRPEGEGESAAARVLPLLESIPVIATGHSMRRGGVQGEGEVPDFQYATITLRVRPEQAQRLLLAQKTGEVSIAVRPEGDGDGPAMVPLGREALLGHAPPARVVRPRAGVEFIVGGLGGAGEPIAATRRRSGRRS